MTTILSTMNKWSTAQCQNPGLLSFKCTWRTEKGKYERNFPLPHWLASAETPECWGYIFPFFRPASNVSAWTWAGEGLGAFSCWPTELHIMPALSSNGDNKHHMVCTPSTRCIHGHPTSLHTTWIIHLDSVLKLLSALEYKPWLSAILRAKATVNTVQM